MKFSRYWKWQIQFNDYMLRTWYGLQVIKKKVFTLFIMSD